eukprot:gene648-1194_t
MSHRDADSQRDADAKWQIQITDQGVFWPTELVDILADAGKPMPSIACDITQEVQSVRVLRTMHYEGVELGTQREPPTPGKEVGSSSGIGNNNRKVAPPPRHPPSSAQIHGVPSPSRFPGDLSQSHSEEETAQDPGEQEVFSSEGSGRNAEKSADEEPVIEEIFDSSDDGDDDDKDLEEGGSPAPPPVRESSNDGFAGFDAALKQSGKDLNLGKSAETTRDTVMSVDDSPAVSKKRPAAGFSKGTLGSYASVPSSSDFKRTKVDRPPNFGGQASSSARDIPWQKKQPFPRAAGTTGSSYAFSSGNRVVPPSFKHHAVENPYEVTRNVSAQSTGSSATGNDAQLREATRIANVNGDSWKKVLGFKPSERPIVDEAKKKFHVLSRMLHPDKVKTGDPNETLVKESYDKVRAAWDKAQQVCPRKKQNRGNRG